MFSNFTAGSQEGNDTIVNVCLASETLIRDSKAACEDVPKGDHPRVRKVHLAIDCNYML